MCIGASVRHSHVATVTSEERPAQPTFQMERPYRIDSADPVLLPQKVSVATQSMINIMLGLEKRQQAANLWRRCNGLKCRYHHYTY